MNVYDFDGTIYDGDSSIDFYLYCLLRKPGLLTLLPGQLMDFISFKRGKMEKVKFKEKYFSFLRELDDTEEMVESFWKKNAKKIKRWYKEQAAEDDVIISASPYFLLEPICNELHIKYLIASPVHQRNGIFLGLNCEKDIKVTKFKKMFPGRKVDNFYSDSKSDTPMAKFAEKAFLVKRNQINEWDFE